MSLRHSRRGKTDGTQSASQETSHRRLSLHPLHDSGTGATDAGRRRKWLARVRTRGLRVLPPVHPVLSITSDLSRSHWSAVTGAIKDVSGAALGQATVEDVVAGRSSASVVTADAGRYRLETPAGVPFELRVRRDGFADVSLRLTGAARDVTRDVTLQIGGVSDTLVVTASRGAESRAAVTASVTVATASGHRGARCVSAGRRAPLRARPQRRGQRP